MEDRGLPACRCGRLDWFNDGLVIVLDGRNRLAVERVLDPDRRLAGSRWSCTGCGSEVVRGSPLDRRLESVARADDVLERVS
jgi:hypothetical protein